MTLEDLERRVRAVEDRLAIIDVIASYGPSADSADGPWLRSLWAADGDYSFDTTRMPAAELEGLVELPSHQDYLAAGCGHLLTTPHIVIDGDRATAVNHSVVLVHEGDAWKPDRLSANRWELVRTDDGWSVQRRTNSLLDGRAAARGLLGRP